MSVLARDFLLSEPEFVNDLLTFFTSEDCNSELHELIKLTSMPLAEKLPRPNAKTLIGMGYLSMMDFMEYRQKILKKEGGLKMPYATAMLNQLVELGILTEFPRTATEELYRMFKSGGARTKFLRERNLITNMIGGWQYIIAKYGPTVYKIENIDSRGDHSIGTGFIFKATFKNQSKSVIVTNKHVLKDAIKINLLNKEDELVTYKDIVKDEKRDLAYLVLQDSEHQAINHFNSQYKVLKEIVTIGYPSIPMTKLAYQVYHKGEINSQIEDYHDSKLFLISAKTSSGNSGSPIYDKYGMITGIITEELFEKESFYEKGKLPYYAAIPSSEIIDSLNEHIMIW